MDISGCVGKGYSEVYPNTNGLSYTLGCSGSSNLIAATFYPSAGGTYYCPYNWTWYAQELVACGWAAGGLGSIYGTHRMLYNGTYSNYVYTSAY
jgi:hypothetical protein